jgi:hypothetical protein
MNDPEWDVGWEEDDWSTLIHAIHQKNCILMLGPDAALESVKKNGKEELHPLTKILANQLSERIDPGILEKINTSDLAQVAQYYCMEKDRNALEVRVTEFYGERKNLSSELHKNLAALPFYFTITTTPDEMCASALKEEGKKPVIERFHFKDNNKRLVTMGTNKKPLVFHFYGTVDEPDSLVLTENNLLDFLVTLISKKRPLPDNIRSELKDEDKSFLFLGFGFRNWHLRILLYALQGNGKERCSYALEQLLPNRIAEFEQNVIFFKKSSLKIHIFVGNLIQFVKQLRAEYKQRFPLLGAQVFICYASEDETYAKSVFTALENAGISPWIDKENIRGGAEWDRCIKDTLEEVDYVVVLQSQALGKKKIGYVNKEINTALERQKEFQQGLCFIIPVKIDDCPLREDLQHLQTIDLTQQDINEVIETIVSFRQVCVTGGRVCCYNLPSL